MYIIALEKKQNLARQWALPDRIFFACGACQVLAHTFLQSAQGKGFKSYWIKPAKGFCGNHIFASNGEVVFDYHGYSKKTSFVDHTFKKARHWDAEIIALPTDVLISEAKSKSYDGLWLRQPDQFYQNPIPRAETFIKRFN